MNVERTQIVSDITWKENKILHYIIGNIGVSTPFTGDFCHLLITFAYSLDPDKTHRTSVLIWIQTI